MAKDPISSIMKHVNHSPFFDTIVCMTLGVLMVTCKCGYTANILNG